MRQHLRCASASSVFDVQSDVVYQNGAISGIWGETTRNISGEVSGTVSRGRVSARGARRFIETWFIKEAALPWPVLMLLEPAARH